MKFEEKEITSKNGIVGLMFILILMVGFIGSAIYFNNVFFVILEIIPFVLLFGLKIVKPNEAKIYTLFGDYYCTIKKPGYYYINPFSISIKFVKEKIVKPTTAKTNYSGNIEPIFNMTDKISLKTMTLANSNQKINDKSGNPVIVGVNVIWKVENPTLAALNVDNYIEYISIQCDSALREIVKCYPYDSKDENEKTLRDSSDEICNEIKDNLQKRVNNAGILIEDARITNLSYSEEIAAAMLQRQQAKAIIDARTEIVEGAVSMVKMAIKEIESDDTVSLDDERKAQMVSNLLVVLCGNKDAQPIVNSGTIY